MPKRKELAIAIARICIIGSIITWIPLSFAAFTAALNGDVVNAHFYLKLAFKGSFAVVAAVLVVIVIDKLLGRYSGTPDR